MEVRLNKLISDSGLYSRREADKFIEEGRVTVNGSLPHVGQKVTEADIVMLDDIRIKVGKHTSEHAPVARGKAQELVFGDQENKARKKSLRLQRLPKRKQPLRQPAQKVCAPANM